MAAKGAIVGQRPPIYRGSRERLEEERGRKGAYKATGLDNPLNKNANQDSFDSEISQSQFWKAGLFSKMSFWWMNPLVKKGYERPLEEKDVPLLGVADQARTQYSLFVKKMNARKSSLFWAIASCYKSEILISGLFALLRVLTLSSGTLLLKEFINVSSGKEAFRHQGVLLALEFLLLKCLESLSQRQWYFCTRRVGIQVRSLLSAAIYQKQQKLPSFANIKHSSGEIMNYLIVDAYRVGEFPFWFHRTWTTGLQLCIALTILYNTVGPATIESVFIISLSVLLNSPLVKYQQNCHKELMKAQDLRLKAISESMLNMKILKLYGWDLHFKGVIEHIRQLELKWLSAFQLGKAYTSVLFWASPALRIVQDPVNHIPNVIGSVIQARAAFSRISEFLGAPELQKDQSWMEYCAPNQYPIVIKSGCFSWDSSENSNLWATNLEVKKGTKLAICGEVGSGKSTILAAILGEVPRTEGMINIRGKIAYVSQNAWIQSGSVQDNILLGSAMDKKRYTKKLVNGVNLSGGQKQRIQLACALYCDSDIYPLDDPFSSVDRHTATSIFNLMSRGQIMHAAYQEFLVASKEFQDLVNAHKDTADLSNNLWLAANVENPTVSTLNLVLVYIAIEMGMIVFLLFRALLAVDLNIQTPRSLFSQLLGALFHAPMSFFDSTPLGRILSRVINAYISLGVLCVLSWQVLFVAAPMNFMSVTLQRYYLASSKELMRINGTTKSLVANHLGESISGEVTIRAFKQEDCFFTKMLELIDNNASLSFHSFAATEWLTQRLEIMGAAILSSSAFVIALLPLGTFRSGVVGMVLSYGLSLNMLFLFSVQNQCSLANQIISVERLSQYMQIASEGPEIVGGHQILVDWPSVGKIELQYLEASGEKIGIVGRTGSGKTTLINGIFRLVEPSGGNIIIDGQDIATMCLHDLRSRRGLIPQDPILFHGSIRYNFDRQGPFSDEQIFEVIGKCQLVEAVKEKKGLDSQVVEGGSNWSMGQRQLLCLGRTLLRRSRILILDEATSSIDNATDAIIQKIIRTEFKDSTINTIAHRIPTVMDCTKILVIDDGKMVEYDRPQKLLEKEGSLFKGPVNEYCLQASKAGL
ncbi:hypothetical protein BS78_07G103900 [Paspalum vaginatum]|nr:hypothetical protein BS78_07G103900 [Paspalum vaginatum]